MLAASCFKASTNASDKKKKPKKPAASSQPETKNSKGGVASTEDSFLGTLSIGNRE
jgi:hypothetical protein